MWEGAGSRRDPQVVHVVVGRDRRLAAVDGVRVERRTHLGERVRWDLAPPRLRYDDAVLDVAGAARSEFAALDEVARAVQSGRTTAARLADRLATRARQPRRGWLVAVLRDVAAGTCSRWSGSTYVTRRCTDRPRETVVVELDGMLFHNSASQRDADFDRDLVAVAAGAAALRLSYGQEFGRPCWTLALVARTLQRSGWTGSPRPCTGGTRSALVSQPHRAERRHRQGR